MTKMDMTKRTLLLIVLLGGFATVRGQAFAEGPAPAAAPVQGAPSDHGMMGGTGGMMNPEMMQKMSRMMDDCHRMMESKLQDKGAIAPMAPAPAPATKG